MSDFLDIIDLPHKRNRDRSKLFLIFGIIQSAVLFLGFVGSWLHITSIIPSGAIVFLFSLTILIWTGIERQILMVWKSGLNLLATLLVFGIIYFFDLSPSDAKGRIPVLILLFVLADLVFLVFQIVKYRRRKKVLR